MATDVEQISLAALRTRLGDLRDEQSEIENQIDEMMAQRAAERVNKDFETAMEPKRKLLATLGISEAIGDYEQTMKDIVHAWGDKNRATQRVRAAQTHLEEARALVFLNGAIDGKNEAQRNAQLVIALRDDPAYQAARTDLDESLSEETVAEQQVELLRRCFDISKIKTRIAAASIELLAS